MEKRHLIAWMHMKHKNYFTLIPCLLEEFRSSTISHLFLKRLICILITKWIDGHTTGYFADMFVCEGGGKIWIFEHQILSSDWGVDRRCTFTHAMHAFPSNKAQSELILNVHVEHVSQRNLPDSYYRPWSLLIMVNMLDLLSLSNPGSRPIQNF